MLRFRPFHSLSHKSSRSVKCISKNTCKLKYEDIRTLPPLGAQLHTSTVRGCSCVLSQSSSNNQSTVSSNSLPRQHSRGVDTHLQQRRYYSRYYGGEGALSKSYQGQLQASTGSSVSARTYCSVKPWNVDAAGKELLDNAPAPQHADVVVIGGGSLGCNALYHLAKKGVTNTVLVEANKLTAGTTWHTAGLLWDLGRTDTDTELVYRTVRMINQLQEDTGIDPGWINNGGIFVASTQERFDELRRYVTLANALGIEGHLLPPADTKKLYPLMNVDDLYGSFYSPGCGTIDPAGLCEALTRGAKKAGAKVLENCHVTSIKTDKAMLGGKKVTAVQTSRGTITTNKVINATGAWSPNITAMVGLSIPLVAYKHAYVVTETIPGIKNMPNLRDYDASTYLKLQGDALSIGGYEQNPTFLKKRMSTDFAFGLYDLDYEVFSSLTEGHINRLPVLENIGIKSTVCGPESFTPDHKAIMGEDPGVSGFFHCCGFNSAGMMLGGGCGEQIAEWVIHGRPDLDMFSYDVRRYHAPMFADKAWVKERSHEAYAKSYSIVFRHDEPLAGRNRRKSPLHDELAAAGCVFQERLGWERPGWFHSSGAPVQEYDWYQSYGNAPKEDQTYINLLKQEYTFDHPPNEEQIKKECMACRNAVVGYDMSYFGKLYLSGPDAAAAADHLFTANTRKPEGSVVYTCMLNARGGVEADLTVSVVSGGSGSPCDPRFNGTGYYLAVGGAAATQNYAHIVAQIRQHRWDVQLKDHTEDMALFSVQGPKSRDLLSRLTSADLSNEAFPFGTHQIITLAGRQLRAMRVSFVGELGWELHIPRDAAVAVYRAVREEGQHLGFLDSGYRAMDCLSNEKGYRHWHSDVRMDDTPLEAGLAYTCKLKTDIPFLGREALEKQKAEGIKKRYIVLSVDGLAKPMYGYESIKRDGVHIGVVRRAEPAYSLDTTLVHGYVKTRDGGVVTRDFLKSGSWSVEAMGEEYPATLHLKQPFDPSNERIRGNYQ